MSWQGVQPVWGLWFPPDWQQPERLLKAWTPGARLFTAWNGWLLVYPEPRLQPTQNLPALPVLAHHQGWSSDPRLQPPPGQLALRWHGQSWTGPRFPADLSQLWDWGQLRHSQAEKPTLIMPALTRTAPEQVRQILPAVPPPAPERERMLQRLAEPAQPRNPLLGLFDLLRSFFGSPENQRYIDNMLRLFEQKNWQEALRHAIPIQETSRQQLDAFMGQLKPRDNLNFTSPAETGSSIGTSLHGLDLLKAVYRKALHQLTEAGRIDEAAFVLGELLDGTAAAVELLEKHGKLEAAARLATLKGLPAPLQVRLWFQAGKPQTALILARRYGVQAEALQLMARKNPELADQFRAVWATDLADAGCISQALTVGWPVRERLEDFELWLRTALNTPGPASLEALLHGLQDPGICQRLQLPDKLEALFQDQDLLTQPRRRQLLERLAATRMESQHPQLQSWALDTARRVMRQANSPVPLGDQRILDFLIHLSGDPWLQADRPAPLKEAGPRWGLWSESNDQKGLTSIYDALWLGDGRLLLALGQAGLVVLSHKGVVAQRFAQAAYQLVDGERPLILNGAQISRFEGGAVRYWCQAGFDRCCDSHDGYHWIVWSGRQLYTIDLTSKEWRALHRLELDSPPREVSRNGPTAVVVGEERMQLLKVPHLERIREFTLPVGTRLCTAEGPQAIFQVGNLWKFSVHPLELEGEPDRFRERNGFCLVETASAGGMHLLVFPLANPSQQLSLKLPEAGRMQARIHGHILTVCDDQGRILVADLKTRAWLGRFYL
ncbi:MAG: hypothetical protein J0I12_03945 [Candidatus Eremiobacteraeota bacterium]|nr:hypothetical protein [Candidatus Eremiobacteraeota bacterium]